jgi:hypothetical protein
MDLDLALFKELGPFGVLLGVGYRMYQDLKKELIASQASNAALVERVISTLQDNTKSQTAAAGALENVAVAIRDLGRDVREFVFRQVHNEEKAAR